MVLACGKTVETLPTPAARLTANPIATGHGGGHDLNLRTPDLQESAAWGDQRFREVMGLVERFAAEQGLAVPPIDEPKNLAARGPEWLDLSDFGAAVFAGGFRPDYRSWLPWPEAFDGLGFPLQRDGVSTVVPGLFLVGVHFMRTRKSSLLLGVAEDATIVSRHVVAFLDRVHG